MKYQVLLTEEATTDLSNLEIIEKKKVLKAFDIIENVDIKAVNTKQLDNKLFEIKTDNIRSVYAYSKNKVIIVALIFLKKTQKTPKKYITNAANILKEYLK